MVCTSVDESLRALSKVRASVVMRGGSSEGQSGWSSSVAMSERHMKRSSLS